MLSNGSYGAEKDLFVLSRLVEEYRQMLEISDCCTLPNDQIRRRMWIKPIHT
jgi:hypothetical protein